MAVVDNKFTITYASNLASPATGEQVGGTVASNDYQLHGPYVIDKSYDSIRIVFDVVVVATSYATLKTRSDSLEVAFRQRDRSLRIDIDGTLWTYTINEDILNTVSSISKSGDPESDRGYSRVYTISVEGELPAEESSKNGLRELSVNVNYEASRQKIVTMQGVYTAVPENEGNSTPVLASVQYLNASNGFDSTAATLLTGIDSSASFELVDEEYTHDRLDHTCDFTRQYIEQLESQTTTALSAGLDTNNIRDHRIVFSENLQHPGDSRYGIHRLRRVNATYDASIDIDQSTDLQTLYTGTIKPHITALFQLNFSPLIFTEEESRIAYDETSKRLSVTITFLYQTPGGGSVVEITETLAFRESRTIDETPLHGQGEFSAEVDPGWARRERIATRTVVVAGTAKPTRRIGVEASSGGAGKIKGLESTPKVRSSGWNIVQNVSQTQRKIVGDPGSGDQMILTILTETVIERYTEKPGRRQRVNF